MQNLWQDDEDLLLHDCLPGWIARSLSMSGIDRMSQLSGKKNAELLKLPGVGPRSVKLIRSAIRKFSRTRKHSSVAHSQE
ncbi:helix-hairpin-helix domain-containing protein [Phyllobacterium endophyticum]|nr:helix-hairpin-helix domain-containing protein [Phyllobacterium endophyticum]